MQARATSRSGLLTGFRTATQRRRSFSVSTSTNKQIRDAYILSAARTPTAKVKPIASSVSRGKLLTVSELV